MEKYKRIKVFITVKTYPVPSDKYIETVCTAGITENHKWVRICLPRYPEYDRQKDFLESVGSLTGDKGRDGVVFFKVELGERAGGDYLSAGHPVVRDLLGRCFSVVADGDMILRGRRNGTSLVFVG